MANIAEFQKSGRLPLSHEPRANRQTIWPIDDPTDNDVQLSAPWPHRYGSFRQVNDRWTGAFDTEARASRMSFMVDDTLLPRAPPPHNMHQHWAGRRQTWLAPVTNEPEGLKERVWTGEFDVERRPSWVNRTSEGFEGDMGFSDEKVGMENGSYLVQWEDGDVENPLNFAKGKKWTNAMILAFAVFMVSIASSGFSQGTRDMKTEFNVGQTVALMTTSTFVLGFAAGALILSPLSEVYGRRELYIGTFGAFVALSGATGLANSMTTIIVLRFFGGLAGSFTQAVAPAVVADMFEAQERGLVLSIFTLAGLMGQNVGPIICGFLDAKYGWRSIAIVVTAASLPTWIVLSFTFPETYAPVLLQRRANNLTKTTGKKHIVAGASPKPISQQLRVGALRPWIMLIYEPIVTLLSLFLSVVHGTLFLLFAAYPIVFQQTRGWPQGVASLPFLALVIGIIISLFYVALIDQARYARVVKKCNGAAPPEARLPPAMLGATALPIGLFWFAWTNDPKIHWFVSVSAGTLFGFGMVLLYMSLTNYIVDAYMGYSASALAASTVLRSIAGAAFPLFTASLYEKLGIHWASSVPGFLALVFVPCLIGFYKWGHILRTKTRFGQEAAEMRK
ncbi:MFS general substrate transporter [Massarina eburnea CBS 473.64]|uniref:MFS general substrate transporter n=1 Tax=Massarina eburnea CBS 473.64 TaxID=1395130 RepID=A0A6A6S3V4_9PLEO|nr:MFS general substrate transporter [Massarina eburnea CBS 473.64]